MKTLLLLSALAMSIAVPGAFAKTISISFDGFCDGLDITANKTNRTALETGNGCDEGAHFGAGTIGKIKNRGNAITFGVNLSGKGDTKDQYIYVVDYPLVTGGTWSNFWTSDGKTISRINTGTYTVSNGLRRSGHGLKPSTAVH